jgi:hypothetical protein
MGRLDMEAAGGAGRAAAGNGAGMAGGLMRAPIGGRTARTANIVALSGGARRIERAQRPAADSLDAIFGTGPFSHQLVLSLDWAAGALDALAAAVAESGAALQALNISELDGGYSAKIWIKGVSCDTARRLSDRIAALAPVSYAHVEHHLGRTAPGS